MNPRPTGPKPVALPNCATPRKVIMKLVSPQGFEPRTHGLEGRCSIQLSYEPTHLVKLERKTRFELATLALARRCSTPEPLPHMINLKKMVEGDGFEPSKAQLTDLQSAPFGHSGIPRKIGAGGGNRTPNLLITNQLLYR